MRIAKLTVGIDNSGIAYNSSQELETDKARGTVLADGKVVRGLGTHFASAVAKERYDKLTARSNEIRAQFARRFGRAMLVSTFVITRAGEAYEFAKQFEADKPDIIVDITELDLSGELGERELMDWATQYKDQLKRVPLGRSQEADEEGLNALETLSKCPVITRETADAIQRMVSEVRIGKMNRVDLKRGISLLKVGMDQASLMAPRSRPQLEPTPAQ